MEYSHLSNLIQERANAFGDQEALRLKDKKSGEWQSVSWEDFSKKIIAVARSMCHVGVEPQSNIGVYSQNMVECLYIDFGAFANRAVTVPMYATASVPQISYIINEAEIRLLFVGEQAQYDNAWQVFKNSVFLKQIVILDKDVVRAPEDKTSMYFEFFSSPKNRTSQDIITVDKRTKSAQVEDVAHLIYTSGTTGEPKGVILTHDNYLEALKIHDIRLNYLPQRFLSLSFLPLAHIFEKAWTFYCLHRGCTIAVNLDPREIQASVKELKPEAMCSVPRFWEKVYAGVQEKIEDSNFILRHIFLGAISTGEKYCIGYINKGRKPPFFLRWRFKWCEKMVYSKLKKTIGIEQGLIFPCAGAMLSEEIIRFLRAVNIPLVYGYGLTETTATVSCFPQMEYEIGTVGKVMPSIEVRIGTNNEIQVKGKTVMNGYYKKPDATAAAFTVDGWLRTGDAGSLTENDGIVLTERIKDLYKTSNGKYIAPQQLETRLIQDKFIDGAFVIGDQRKYVSALIVPDYNELKKYAEEQGISFGSEEDLCNNLQIIKLYEARITDMQNEFANFEQIKRFTLLPHAFSIDSGELTDTLKMKRVAILEKYGEIIDKMYSE
ncbi:long-chain-fatty-acid--CoA ligase [Bacteroidia bacterium]|nr:long-chain-fatty-acid--CoA ligase [Bacteroidia bacterium]GHT63104.1 long-chain-fatty-acid--CoA ligase [Bacteroidia bacterium]